MDRVAEYQYWAALIAKELLGTIGESEAEELAEWKNADEQHRQLYERLRSRDYAKNILDYQKIDTDEGLRKYYSRYPQRKNHQIYRWISVAASVVILLGSGLLFFHKGQPGTEETTDIQPGTAKAQLILSDGSVRLLEQTGKEEIRLGKLVVLNNGTQIEYTTEADTLPGKQESAPKYSELRVPVGGEYQLLLADRTKVWLNSQSRLRFPESFTGGERCVYLEGEAYFEVAHDAKRPFCVKTKENVDIQVLGTSFNLRAYEDEGTVETVLEKGCVKMRGVRESIVLQPGVRAVYEQKQRKMSQASVDTELYTSWHKGHYVFQEETVENILNKLSRWYGMNVFFSNEKAKEVAFSGSIRKYETIINLLEAMEISGGVHFELKGKTIIVNQGY